MEMIEEKWHAMTEDAVCRELSTSRDGLTKEDAEQRLVQYGINALPVKKPPTLWEILLHQVLNPLIFILIAAAAASLAIGEITDATFCENNNLENAPQENGFLSPSVKMTGAPPTSCMLQSHSLLKSTPPSIWSYITIGHI